jgi:hypothetical protein
LRKSRGHFSIFPNDITQFRSAAPTALPVFLSIRNSGAISHARLH